MDRPIRTWVKMLTWQGLGLVTMTLAGAAITGSVSAGGVLAAVNTAIGSVAYILHERLWARIGWGRRG